MKHRHSFKLKRRYKSIVMKEVFSFGKREIDEIALNVGTVQNGAKLFNESSNVNDPRLMPSAIDNELYYEYGYLGTTIFLLNIIEFGKSYFHKDSYIYPAMFCFRQYIENIIKTIVLKYEPNTKFSPRHDLNDFWRELLRYIDFDDAVENVGYIIEELQNIDQNATAFRYSGALNAAYEKNPQVFSMLIDVKKLRHRVLQIYRFFDGLYEEACVKYDQRKQIDNPNKFVEE